MLEVGKCPEMEHYQDGHDFTVRERCFTMTETDAGRGYEKDMSSPMSISVG